MELLSGLLAAFAALVFFAGIALAETKTHRLALQISDNDADKMTLSFRGESRLRLTSCSQSPVRSMFACGARRTRDFQIA